MALNKRELLEPSQRDSGQGGDQVTRARNHYYQAAQAWDVDRLRYALVARNRAYLLALASVIVIIALAIAIAHLAPLKTVEVAVFSYDERTGALRKINIEGDVETITGDEAFIRGQIYQFILNYETWDTIDMQHRYDWLRMVLTPALLQSFSNESNRQNPNALINTIGDKNRRSVTVKNISFLNKTTVHVQFATQITREQAQPVVEEWAAVVEYTFSQRPKEGEAVYLNPFGFQITSYRRDSMIR